MSTNRIGDLNDAIVAAGIPIDGVGRNPDGTIRIDFKPAATAAQRTQAQAIAAGFDMRPRRVRTVAEIDADIAALPVAQQNMVTRVMRAQMIRDNADARDALKALGIPDIPLDTPIA